ncbi:MAG: helix-turn-helix domain-containing protein [Streptosporangiales bacterium]|nr:helix-turn-helix domain-containing protein [Streptosporangiales bacterium]
MGDAGDGWEFVDAGRLLPGFVVSSVGYRIELGTPTIHRGLPSPSLTFVLSLDEPVVGGFTPEQAAGPGALSTEIVLGGLHTRPAYLTQPKVQTGIQLAVRPLAARALFGLPSGELREQMLQGVDVLGPETERLRQRMSELPTWDERFAVLVEHLRARLAAAPSGPSEPRAEVTEAWKWIAWHRGNGSMAELARHVHLSERQLTAVFRAELGLSPKAVSRLMRFEHARQRIAGAVRAGTPLELSATAATCGYYDHSHLVRDFQQYVGVSPSLWVEEERRNIQAGAAQPAEEFPS